MCCSRPPFALVDFGVGALAALLAPDASVAHGNLRAHSRTASTSMSGAHPPERQNEIEGTAASRLTPISVMLRLLRSSTLASVALVSVPEPALLSAARGAKKDAGCLMPQNSASLVLFFSQLRHFSHTGLPLRSA